MNELSKNLMAVVMRNGVIIWKEKDRLEELAKILTSGGKVGFIKIDDEMINAADVSGIFTSQTMEEMTRRKNGQWECKFGRWHDRNMKCECALIQNDTCSKCQQKMTGYVGTGNSKICLDCYKNLYPPHPRINDLRKAGNGHYSTLPDSLKN